MNVKIENNQNLQNLKRKVTTPNSSSSEEDNLAPPIVESDTDSVMESEVEGESPEVEIGQFVLVRFDLHQKSVEYVGMVVAKSDGEYKIKFYKRTPQGAYVQNDEVAFVDSAQIIQIIGAPMSSGTTARTLGSVSFGGKITCKDYELR